jgi:DNA-binding transcriptional regulator YiaG
MGAMGAAKPPDQKKSQKRQKTSGLEIQKQRKRNDVSHNNFTLSKF